MIISENTKDLKINDQIRERERMKQTMIEMNVIKHHTTENINEKIFGSFKKSIKQLNFQLNE